MEELQKKLIMRIEKNKTLEEEKNSLLKNAIENIQPLLEKHFIPYLDLLPQAREILKFEDSLNFPIQGTDFHAVFFNGDFSSISTAYSKGRKIVGFYSDKYDSHRILLTINSLDEPFPFKSIIFKEKTHFITPPSSFHENYFNSPKSSNYREFYLDFITQFPIIKDCVEVFFENIGSNESSILEKQISKLKSFQSF